jgi:hypothetical protein
MSFAELVTKYAPLVVLHADDKLRPSSADWFLARSTLRWATGRRLGGDAVPEAGAEVEAGKLGAAASNPYHRGRYLASSLTRPLDDHPARRGGPPLEQGFFLRLREEAFARGDKGGSPDPSVYAGPMTYWDYEENTRALTYWLFYAGSSPPLGILRAGEQIGTRGPPAAAVPEEVQAADAAAKLEEFQRAYPGLAREAAPAERTRGIADVIKRLRVVAAGVRALLRKDDVLHEGDWERITIYLDETDPQNRPPVAVAFYRHSTSTFEDWDKVKKGGSHPIVYSAIGSHASLPTPDFGFIDVGDPDGPRWRTWKDLAPVAEQPWYGFGGAWGRLGKVVEATGPLGPGAPWKHAAPRPTA